MNQPQQGSVFFGTVCVLFSSTLWGTTGAAATFAPEVSPFAIGAAAMGGGGLLQAVMAAKPIVENIPKIIANWQLFLIGSLAIIIYPLAFYAAMNMAGVAVGNVVSIGLAPLAAAVFERLFEKRRLSYRWRIGAALGISGAVVLCLAKTKGQYHGDMLQEIVGIGLGVIAASTYALYSWAARQMMQRGVATRAAMGSLFGAASIFLLPMLLWIGAPFLNSINNAAVGVYMAVLPMFVGYLCFGYGLASISVSTVTVLTLFEPVVAAILAVVVVGEVLSPMAWGGIFMIIGCLIILTVPMPRRFHIA